MQRTRSSPTTARTGSTNCSGTIRSAISRLRRASGSWVGKTLTLVRGSLRGNARHVYEVVDDDKYSMKIQFSPDAEGWSDVLTGVYKRIN